MRPYSQGESLFNLIQSAVPDFVEADYPLFMEFLTTYLRFLEEYRTYSELNVYPQYGNVPNSTVQITNVLGGSLYEGRKLLDYRDVATSLDEFKTHFLAMFGKNFPQYSYVPLDFLVRSLRQFYQGKGTVESIQWFFRALFNEHAEVYFPRTDILKVSDGSWVAPITLKVTTPTNGHPNSDVPKFYVGQRVHTSTGSAQVEASITYVVGQAYNQNIVVNELILKFDTIVGTFTPGQTLINDDSDTKVITTILPVITDVLVKSGGSEYLPGDVVSVSEGPAGGYGYGAFGVVSVVTNAAISGVTVTDGGDGYITGLPCSFVSTTGHDASAVVQDVVYGDYLLEDGSGYFALESQTPDGTDRFQLEDTNIIFLELIIDPFCNAIAAIVLTNANYGTASGVSQLNGVTFDSELSFALAASASKPFMHPWVFTDVNETVATLANAACVLTMVTDTFFANGATVYSLAHAQDITSNDSTSNVSANVIVSQIAQGGTDTLFLKDFRGLNKFSTNVLLKQSGNGVLQLGTITTDGSANVSGTGTSFTATVRPNTHLRFGPDGVPAVVREVVNNTFLTTYGATGVPLVANTYNIVPVGTVTSITPQEQRFYGKIKSVRLLAAGSGYQTPPTAVCDSVSGRAQEFFFLDPGADMIPQTVDDVITASNDRVNLFRNAALRMRQDSGQVQKVKVINSGVNYQDANTIQITAQHGTPRVGDEASFIPLVGAVTHNPGQFTTSSGFLSADKFLQDASFYNDFTYVVRVGESFDRYRDLLLRLVHPAGFNALGRFMDVLEGSIDLVVTDTEMRTRVPLPLSSLISAVAWGNGALMPRTILSLISQYDGSVDI